MTKAERALYERFRRRAARMTPGLARRQMAALNIVRSSFNERELVRAIDAGLVDRLVSSVMSDKALDPALSSFRSQIDQAVMDGGRVWMKDLPGKFSSTSFDVLNPRVIESARGLSHRLVTELKGEMRETFTQHLVRGLEEGKNPRTIARGLRSTLGLAPNQEQAVYNFETMLRNGDREALTRSLRDHRFDRTLGKALGRGGTGLSEKQIQNMSSAYRRRMVAFNAETHARTAALESNKLGQHLSWQDGIDKGAIDPERSIKTWSSVGDSRVREEHVAMDGETVRYDEAFSDGSMVPGEADWNCRCIAMYHQAKDKETASKRIAESDKRVQSELVGARGRFEGIRPGETKDEFQKRRRRERREERKRRKKKVAPKPVLPKPTPTPEPKPTPTPPLPVTGGSKKRLPGETADEFQKRRRRERAAARKAKKEAGGGAKVKEPTPPPYDLDEIERRLAIASRDEELIAAKRRVADIKIAMSKEKTNSPAWIKLADDEMRARRDLQQLLWKKKPGEGNLKSGSDVFREVLAIKDPAMRTKAKITVDSLGFNMMVVDDVEDGVHAFRSMVPAKYVPNGSVKVKRSPTGRGYYQDSFQSAFIQDIGSGVRDTTVHELGHWLEYRVPKIQKAAKDFLKRRTKGEKMQSLKKLFPYSNYRADEFVKPDKFFSHYVGKQYPTSTEVISMGMEAMQRDPLKFIREDREHFELILKIILGHY